MAPKTKATKPTKKAGTKKPAAKKEATRELKAKTGVKAGGRSLQHNQSVVRP